jgi:endoglucanase
MVGQRALVVGREGVVAAGVFASPSGHAITPPENHRKIDFYKFFLDVGAESRAEAEAAGVHIGAAVIWEAPTRLTGNRITTPAVDDRVGLASIQLALERLDHGQLGCELWVAATVMEENFLHGARAMAANERFDAVIAIDNTPAGDIPVLDPTALDTKLGAGPVVVFHDHLIAYSRELAWTLHDAAAAAAIPIQHGAFSNFTTDGVAFLDGGSPTVAIGPATRYTHTAYETLDVRDVDATANLLVAYACSNRSRSEDG